MQYSPPYKITGKIIDLISKISELVGGYYAKEDLRLNRINRIKTIQGSLAIEGNTLTTEQITAILDGKPVVAPMNEILEVRNAIKAYELLDSLDPFSIEDLLKAHLAMQAGLIDDTGHFRSGGVGIASGNQIIHYAPGADRVPFLIKDLFDWLSKTDEHPLIVSSVFHYEFEFIHPFSDGNGRTGRLWQTLILTLWRPFFRNVPIENIVYRYRQNYYNAISVSGGEQGCTPFIEFMLEVILETLSTQETTSKTTQEKILEQITLNPKITRRELASLLGLSADGVKYHLAKMSREGILIHRGSTRSGYWEVKSL